MGEICCFYSYALSPTIFDEFEKNRFHLISLGPNLSNFDKNGQGWAWADKMNSVFVISFKNG